jgi:hypothetical protein
MEEPKAPQECPFCAGRGDHDVWKQGFSAEHELWHAKHSIGIMLQNQLYQGLAIERLNKEVKKLKEQNVNLEIHI